MQKHEPVLLNDFISLVAPITGCWIDGTFGAGGYTRALLQNGACKVLIVKIYHISIFILYVLEEHFCRRILIDC